MQDLTITVDDSSPTFHYSPSPGWSSATPLEDAKLSSYFKNTTTYTNTSQANVTFEFWGSSIQIIGTKSQNHGNFRVQLDDQVFDSLTGHSETPASYQQQLFAQSGLSSGKHNVVMTNTQDGMFVDIDFVTWDPVLGEGGDNVILNTIPDDSRAIVYSGSWDTDPSQLGTFVGGTGHETKKPGSSLEFTFNGIALAIYGPADPNGAPYTVQVDNSPQQNYSFYTSQYTPQSLLFFQGNLDMGVDEHTVRVTHAGVGSDENKTLAIDFINVYSRSTFEIRAMDTGGGGTSKSTIAAVIMGIIAGLLLFFIALMYCLNRGKKLGQFEWNIFKRDSWNFNKPETARRVRREDASEGFELDGGGYATVLTPEGGATRNEPGTARSAASVTSGDDSEIGLIRPHRDEVSEIASTPRPNKQRWSFSGLSVLNQPLVIPKSSMGIIGMAGAARQLNIPSGQDGKKNLTTASASVPIPLPPGLAGTSSGAFANSRSKRRETILSWKPEPENSQPPPSEAPPPPPASETSQHESEEPPLSKESSKTSQEDLPVLRERPSLRVNQFGSEGSLPLRSASLEPDAPSPFLPLEIPRSPIGRGELLLHRIPTMPPSPSGGRPSAQIATETPGTVEPQELLTPTSGPSERSSTSIDWSRSRPTSAQGESVSLRSRRERPRSAGSILGPRMRVPRTPQQGSKRDRDLGESSRTDKQDGDETA